MAHLAFLDDSSGRESPSISSFRRSQSCRSILMDASSVNTVRSDIHKSSSSSLALHHGDDDHSSAGYSVKSCAAWHAAKKTIKANRLYRQQLTNANQTIEELQKQAKEDKKKLQKELAKAQGRVKRLGSDTKDVQKQHHKEMVALQKELKRANRAQERLKKDLVAAQERNASLKSDMRDLKNEHCYQMTDLQASLNFSLRESRRLKRVEYNLQNELAETQERLKDAERELGVLRVSSKSTKADYCWSPTVSPTSTTKLLHKLDDDELTYSCSDDDLSNNSSGSAAVPLPDAGTDILENAKARGMTEREIKQELVIQNLMKKIEALEGAACGRGEQEREVPS